MLYILHNNKDLDQVTKDILPLLKGEDYKLLKYAPDLTLSENHDAVIVTYLSDKDLAKFLPKAAKNNWEVALLPHPELEFTRKGLGIEGNLKESIEDILSVKESKSLDLLFCDGLPVFQSVNIGSVFILKRKDHKNNIFSEVYNFLLNIKKLSGLSHRKFDLSADGETILNTSGLGIVIVEHSSSSVVSKRLIEESSMNDGMFHVLIISPQNILDLIWFLFKSLAPNPKILSHLPDFIGQIKTSNITIKNTGAIEFTVDGNKQTAEEIEINVEPQVLKLHQTSVYINDKNGAESKKSIKTEKLPTGEKRDELTKRNLPWWPRATTEEFQELFKVLRENAKLSSPFIVMMILSALIASFGLFGDSSPVIIGAMILAPIISPIVSFSMGMVRYDTNMLKTGISTILIGTVVALIVAAGVSLIIPLKVITSEIDARLSPTLLDMGIAVASGIAAAYAHAKEGIAKSLAGVAIAVALVPPLAVAGIGIGWMDWEVFSGAFLLYLTNLAGIIMFAGITFLILGFAPFRRARWGLIYTLVILIGVMIPLSLSFSRIQTEAKITSELEGIKLENVILKDVKVRTGKPLMVSLKLVSSEAIEAKTMELIKREIEEKIHKPITLEVISAIEF